MYNAFRKHYDVTPITNIEKEKLSDGKDVVYELIVEDDNNLKKKLNMKFTCWLMIVKLICY